MTLAEGKLRVAEFVTMACNNSTAIFIPVGVKVS